MHTLTVVLLPRDCPNLWEAAVELLKPHRIDWEDVQKGWRLDYWAMGHGNIADEFTAIELEISDGDLAENVCLVSRIKGVGLKGSGLFSRAASWSEGAFQVQASRAPFCPAVVAEWYSSADARPQRVQFGLRLGSIHQGTPHSRQIGVARYRQPGPICRRLLAGVG